MAGGSCSSATLRLLHCLFVALTLLGLSPFVPAQIRLLPAQISDGNWKHFPENPKKTAPNYAPDPLPSRTGRDAETGRASGLVLATCAPFTIARTSFCVRPTTARVLQTPQPQPSQRSLNGVLADEEIRRRRLTLLRSAWPPKRAHSKMT